MKHFEQIPNFNIKNSLEKIPGVSDVQKIELDADYFEWAKDKLSPEEYETIKTNYETLEAHKFKYLSDGLSIPGFIYNPKEMKHQLPITVWNRGGTNEIGSIDNAEGKRGPLYANTPCELAKTGTVVVASEYRGGLGSEGKDEWGGADLNDVIRIKEIADKLPMCKPGKAIVAGVSRGGMMSYMLAAKEPWVKAVISLSGTTDLIDLVKERPEMGEVFTEAFGGGEEEMKKRSATHFYQSIPKETSILIMHGAKDERVSVEQPRKLAKLLLSDGHAVQYHEFPDEGHASFSDPNNPHHEDMNKIIELFMKSQL